jgi:hypothetical protein
MLSNTRIIFNSKFGTVEEKDVDVCFTVAAQLV